VSRFDVQIRFRSRKSMPLVLKRWTNFNIVVLSMSRRSHSSSPSIRPAKRARISQLTSEDFKGGTFLAPMVRSGARALVGFQPLLIAIDRCSVPTRLFALKYGATLVWGPEVVDKAILHAERVVDRESATSCFRKCMFIQNME
jgi:hypothetical protein